MIESMRGRAWWVGGALAMVTVAFACVGEDAVGTPSPVADAATQVPTPPADGAVVTTPQDAGPDVFIPGDGGCDRTMPFTDFSPALGEVNKGGRNETAPRLSPDELVMWATLGDPGAALVYLHRFERKSRTDPWVDKGLLFGESIARRELWSSRDGKRLYYAQAESSVWKLVGASFWDDGGVSGIAFLKGLDGFSDDLSPFLSDDEQELWMASDQPAGPGGDYDLQRSVRVDGGWSKPERVSELNSTANELHVVLTADRRTVYFTSARGRGGALLSIWTATRNQPGDTFGAPALVPDFAGFETGNLSAAPGWLSPDECRMYFATNRDNGVDFDIYVASRR